MTAMHAISLQHCFEDNRNYTTHTHTRSLQTTWKQVRPSSVTAVYPHMPILHVANMLDESASAWATRCMLASVHGQTSLGFAIRVVANKHAIRFVRFWASGGAKFPKMWDSLPRTSINHRAKFDAASFILGWEIRNRTNTHTHNYKKTNKQQPIYPHLAYRRVWITRMGMKIQQEQLRKHNG